MKFYLTLSNSHEKAEKDKDNGNGMAKERNEFTRARKKMRKVGAKEMNLSQKIIPASLKFT